MAGYFPGAVMTTRILVIAHAPLAGALRECARHVFPDCLDAVLTLDVPPDEAPEATLARAQTLLGAGHWPASVVSQPTLVLADMLGATPCNIAQRLVDCCGQRRLVSGVNLPMLLRAICYRNEPLETLVLRAVDGGKAGVMRVASSVQPQALQCPGQCKAHA